MTASLTKYCNEGCQRSVQGQLSNVIELPKCFKFQFLKILSDYQISAQAKALAPLELHALYRSIVTGAIKLSLIKIFKNLPNTLPNKISYNPNIAADAGRRSGGVPRR